MTHDVVALVVADDVELTVVDILGSLLLLLYVFYSRSVRVNHTERVGRISPNESVLTCHISGHLGIGFLAVHHAELPVGAVGAGHGNRKR